MATRHGRRLNTTEQGYGHGHQSLRRQVAVLVERGDAWCARCGGWIAPGSPWCLDHRDDRRGYLGPSHRGCNARAGQAAATRARLTGPRLAFQEDATARAIAFAERENAYWAQVERQAARRPPNPRIDPPRPVA